MVIAVSVVSCEKSRRVVAEASAQRAGADLVFYPLPPLDVSTDAPSPSVQSTHSVGRERLT